MTLVAHYGLELHQIDVKTALLNGDLLENVYMAQPKGFVVKEKEHKGCHLKKSIYGLKQIYRKWYLMFDETIISFGFKKMWRTIVFMQNLGARNLFPLSYMWMTFYSVVVMSVCYWKPRGFCPPILI
jgi:hypothetical protein